MGTPGSGTEGVEAHLRAALSSERDRIMGEVVEILAKSRLARVVRDVASGSQGTQGLLRAMEDALDGQTTQTRVFWLETLFPSLLERGVTLIDISRVSARIHIAIALILVAQLAPEWRKEGGEWLGVFFSSLQADIVRQCLGAAVAAAVGVASTSSPDGALTEPSPAADVP
ncbi:hypothetical protein [Pendulispora albinea]|uniref:Uncharacterized protein n=1 Tax=Pendulispora albinea TaxID=2741071 RepID=A0ABZ2LKK0_9BACT